MTQLIRGLHNLKPFSRGSVLTIGNFDGVHRGHQALLRTVKEAAQKHGMRSVVVTFEPLPKEFFGAHKVVPRLTRFREKFSAIASLGIDAMLVIRFDKKFSEMTAEDFLENILCKGFAAKHIIIGDDFRFGKNRLGDFYFLKKSGEKYGFTIEAMPTILMDNIRVSSTSVREALKTANHALAEQLLGRPYTMQGKVVHGDKLGRKLGFPTANIYLHRVATPVSGIYAVRMHGLQQKILQGVANVGTRPTIGGTRSLLEVHLFDFHDEIYGKHVTVEFCQKIRDEEKFANLDELKNAMASDVAIAKKFFLEE